MRLNDALDLISIRSCHSPARITRYCVCMPAIMYFKYDVVNKDHCRGGFDGYLICADVVGFLNARFGRRFFWRYFTGVFYR